jgi:hypothetical protein
VEAVAWFAARADMVATAAAISCLLLVRASVREGRKPFAWLALLCFALGLFTKESLLPFPLVVWLWLRWLGVSQAGWHTVPYWVMVALFWWLRMRAVGGLGAYPGAWETLYQPWRLGLHLLLYLVQLPMPTILFGLGRDGQDTLLWLGWLAATLWMARAFIKHSDQTAYIWRAGLYEAIPLLLPERAQQPVYALSRFTMRLASDTAVIYSSGWRRRLSRREDIFLPPEGLQLPPDATRHQHYLQPHRLQIRSELGAELLATALSGWAVRARQEGRRASPPLRHLNGAFLAACTEVEQHGEQVGVVHDAVAVGVFRCTVGAKGEQHCQQVSIVHDAVIVHIPKRFGNAAAATNPVHVEDACVYPSEVLLYAKEVTLSV